MSEPGSGPILLKLGGSLITDKRVKETARSDVLGRIADELAASRESWRERGLILGHGSGSFGHQAAAGTPLASRDRGDAQALRRSTAVTQDAAARLHRMVVASLLGAGIEPFSIAPGGWMTCDGGQVATLHLDPLLGALRLGMVPVVHGDVVVDRSLGMRIVSTEEVFHILVSELSRVGARPARAIWLGETDGILDREGSSIPRVTEESLDRARLATGGSDAVDVTGGMRLRLETAWTLAQAGVPSWIGDGRRARSLSEGLAGRGEGGTTVVAAAEEQE